MNNRLIGPNMLDISVLNHPEHVKRPRGVSADRFTDPVPKEFLCGTCKQVVRQPVECSKCGVLYCLNCRGLHFISSFPLNRDLRCPECKEISILKQPSRILRKIIGSLQVRCKKLGCPEVVSLDRLKLHQKECAYKRINCKRRVCRAVGRRKDFLKACGTGQVFFICSERCRHLVEFETCLTLKDKVSALTMYQSILTKVSISV